MHTRYSHLLGLGLCLAVVGCDRTDPVSPDSSSTEPQPATTTATSLHFRQLAAGWAHSCGVTAANVAYCWGANSFGQLGDGTTTKRITPVPVAGGHAFRILTGGDHHTCGVTTDDRVFCWGGNEQGQIGDGSTTQRTRPVPVGGTRRFVQLDAGYNSTCALDSSSRKAFCWGDNSYGQLGLAKTVARRLTPGAVDGSRPFRMVSAGGWHTCAVTPADVAYCWGRNSIGQLGDGTNTQRIAPVPVAGGRSFRYVSAGGGHTCAVTPGDRGFCWGYGEEGALGDGAATNRSTPRAVAGGLTFDRITAGGAHTCGEASSNRLYCWGDNVYGELGIGNVPVEHELVPTSVAGDLLFTQVSLLGVHTCARTSEHVAYCWGANSQGQLGDGTTTPHNSPAPVDGS